MKDFIRYFEKQRKSFPNLDRDWYITKQSLILGLGLIMLGFLCFAVAIIFREQMQSFGYLLMLVGMISVTIG